MPQAFKDLHWRGDISLKDYLVPETLPEALQMLAEPQRASPRYLRRNRCCRCAPQARI